MAELDVTPQPSRIFKHATGQAQDPIKQNDFRRVDVDWPTAVVRAIRTGSRKIGIVTAAAIGFSLAYLLIATPRYGIHAVIAPSDEQGSTFAAGALGKTLGLKTPGMGGLLPDYYDEFIRTVVSEPVAEELVRRGWLKVIFYRWWNSECSCWRHPWLYIAVTDTRAFLFGGPYWHPPDAYSLYLYMDDHIRFVPVGETDMEELTFSFPDRDAGRRFIRDTVSIADAAVRARSVARVESAKKYLLSEYAKNPQVDFRTMVVSLLMEQERALTTTSAPEMFSGRLVIPPTATDVPTEPNIVLVLAFGVLAGAFVGFTWTFARTIRDMHRESTPSDADLR